LLQCEMTDTFLIVEYVNCGIAKVVCIEGRSMEPVAFTSTVLPSSVDYFEAQDITVSDGFDCH